MIKSSENGIIHQSSIVNSDEMNEIQEDDYDIQAPIMITDLDSNTVSCFDELSLSESATLNQLTRLQTKVSVWQDYWKERESNKHLLIKLVTENRPDTLQKILKNKQDQIDLNQYIYLDGWTLLHHAVTKKIYKVVHVLIKYGCDVNKQTQSMKSTSLHLAVMEKQENIVQLLLANGANPNVEDIDFCTPLHYAAQYSLLEIAKIILTCCKFAINFGIKNNKNMTVADCCRDPRIKFLMKQYCEKNQCVLYQNSHSSRTIETEDGRILFTRSRTDIIEKILHKVQKKNVSQNPIQLSRHVSENVKSSNKRNRQKRQKLKRVHSKAQFSLSNYRRCLHQQTIESLDNYDMIKKIGSGSFGTVFLIRKKHSSKLFALKRLSKKTVQQNSISKYVYAEREVLKNMKHPFILHAFSFFQDFSYLYMVMDFCAGGDLQKKILKEKFQEDVAKKYCCQAVLALEELHNQNYLFRDLKAANVLIDEQGHVKLADFGLAKQSEMSQSFLGSVCYLAPQMLVESDNKPHTAAIDWYLLGVFVYEMLTGLPPFYNNNRMLMFDLIRNAKPKIPQALSPQCKNFLIRTLAKKPKERLGNKGAEEIKNHSWFKDIDWTLVLNKGLQMEVPFVNQKQLRVKEQFEEQFLQKSESQLKFYQNWDFKEGDSK